MAFAPRTPPRGDENALGEEPLLPGSLLARPAPPLTPSRASPAKRVRPALARVQPTAATQLGNERGASAPGPFSSEPAKPAPSIASVPLRGLGDALLSRGLAAASAAAAAAARRETQVLAEELLYPNFKSLHGVCEDMKEDSAIFSTGCAPLDATLGGGLFTGELVELAGPSATGKTQLCHMVAAHVAATTDAAVAYIDTSQSFSPERVLQMHGAWQARGVVVQSEKVTLSSIRCYRALSLQTLFAVLEQLRRDMLALPRAADPLLRVVVIDSMSSLVAPQLGGSACGHAQMMQLVRTIKALAKRFQLVFLVTNHMVGGFRDDAEKPALGLSWTYAADTRLLLAPDREPGAAWASLTKSAKCATGARCLLRPSPCGMEPLQPPPPPPPPPPPR